MICLNMYDYMMCIYLYIYDVYVNICHSLRECHFSCNRLQSIQHGATCFLNHEPFVFFPPQFPTEWKEFAIQMVDDVFV